MTAIKDKIKLLLVRAVAGVVKGEMFAQVRHRMTFAVAIGLKVARNRGGLLVGEGGDFVKSAGALGGLVEEVLVGLEEVLVLEGLRERFLFVSSQFVPHDNLFTYSNGLGICSINKRAEPN